MGEWVYKSLFVLVFVILVFVVQGLVLAGLGSGLTEGAMITPFERVKVSLQSQRSRMVDVSVVTCILEMSGKWTVCSCFLKSPSTYGHARYIVKQNGFGTRGLMKGLTATLLRHGVWNTVYFGFYHNVKDLILPEVCCEYPLFHLCYEIVPLLFRILHSLVDY